MVSPAVAEGTRLGPYEVLDLVGRGGMGEVYRARDPRLGRAVAVKVLPAEVAHDARRLARFEREARAVAALNHPNILTVHDVGNVDGIAYLVTELLEGQTLREWLLTDALPARQALGWALEIVRGLEAAHARGIVHRDLKPSNVFVTTEGRVKILDFGLALAYPGSGAAARSSSTTSAASPAGTVVGTLAYMSPEQLRGSPLDDRSDLFSFGIVLYEMLAGTSPFGRESAADVITAILSDPAPLLSECAPTAKGPLERIVERCLEKRAEDRFASAHDLRLALEPIMERPSGAALSQHPLEPSPYPGLASFTERDAADFFGREREVAALWEKLQTRRLLAVIGPSGAGKTSFVRAGVVPSCPPGWAAAVCTPGRAPLRALAQALVAEFAGDPDTLRRLVAVDEPEDLLDLAAAWRRRHDAALFVCDQFEELFTLNPVQTQAGIAALLGRLATEADVHVLLSLRDDFLIRTQEQPAFEPLLQELTALLPVTGEGLRRAVVEPARKHGYRFEDDALVEELVAAVEGERGALPLLAFAIARLWEERDRERRLLTRAAGEAIGGVEGALARHAEATLERIGPERQGLVREILRNLVTAQGTRAVTDREELLSAFADRDAAEEVLNHLVDARLLTSYELEASDDPPAHHRVEIVHESLLRSWPRLVRWQAQDADGAVLRDQLKQAAHLWEEKGRTADVLWSGTAYREFEFWRERYPGGLTEVEEGFAAAMTTRAKRRRRLRNAVVATAFVTLAGIAAAIAASRQEALQARNDARQEARRAEASRLLAMAEARLEADPTEALALATASLELDDAPAARVFALRAVAEAPPAFETESSLSQNAVFSRDGTRLAAAGFSEDVLVWSDDGGLVARLSGHETSPNNGIRAIWGPGQLLMTGPGGRRGGAVHLWSLPRGLQLRTIEIGSPSWWGVGREHLLVQAIRRDAAGHETYSLRSWLLPDGAVRELATVDWTGLGGSSSWFAPDGRAWLYTKGRRVYWRPLPGDRSADRVMSEYPREVALARPSERALVFREESGELHEWSFDEGRPPERREISLPGTAPPNVLPEASGRWLINRPAADSEVRLWDRWAWPAARPLRLRRKGSWYASSTAQDPEGDWLVATTQNLSRLTFWPLPKRPPVSVDGYVGMMRPLAFSPDGRRLATSWADRTLRVWDIHDGTFQTLAIPERILSSDLVFDAQGRFLFAVGNAGRAYVVPMDGSPPRRLEGLSEETLPAAAAVSPSGRFVATAHSYGSGPRLLAVWDLESGQRQLFDLPASSADTHQTGYEDGIFTAVFSDETTLLTSGDGGVRVWDLESGTHERIYSVDPGRAVRMVVSRDGQTAVVREVTMGEFGKCGVATALDLTKRTSHALPAFGKCVDFLSTALDPTGRITVTGDHDGVLRVGLLAGGEPHLLVGHEGPVDYIAISPDLRWIASTGEDDTLRVWPMPDLEQPPRHTLPHDQLIAKLKSLTNLRAVRDPDALDGWRIELAPFPGWKEVPTW